jgi:hypothetical protein
MCLPPFVPKIPKMEAPAPQVIEQPPIPAPEMTPPAPPPSTPTYPVNQQTPTVGGQNKVDPSRSGSSRNSLVIPLLTNLSLGSGTGLSIPKL